MAKGRMAGNSGVLDTAALVKKLALELGSSVELKDELTHLEDGAGLYMMVFEKFYWRNSSYTSLSVVVTGDSQASYVDIIGAGGGEGLFNLSWGSEEEFVDDMKDLLRDHGFQEIKL